MPALTDAAQALAKRLDRQFRYAMMMEDDTAPKLGDGGWGESGALTIAHATEEFAAGTICGARFQPRTDEDAHQLEQAIAELGW